MPRVARAATETRDYRNQPAYTAAEAARYLKVPVATLRSWLVGREHLTSRGRKQFDRLITPVSNNPTLLSFWNLIEAHVLRGLRSEKSVSIKAVRDALAYAEKELKIERLLLRKELCTSKGSIFLERYGELLHLSTSGQIALKQIFVNHLSRVEWDEWQFPVRLIPFSAAEGERPSPIAIDPGIAFGRPIIRRRGIRTEILAERIDVGESLESVAADYGMTSEEVEAAIVYEHSA